MLVSVVIPLYNKARHIERAVHSVLGQSFRDFEVIVVDDGSTDDGAARVRQITDPRVKLIRQPNAGVSAARNAGIEAATTELIAFLDADDEWLPCFLETVMGLRERHPEAGMYAAAYQYYQDNTITSPQFKDCCTLPQGGLLQDYFLAALGDPPVSATSVLIPKQVLTEVGNFPAGLKRGEDLQTWARIALRYRVAWSPITCAVYNLAADNRACNEISWNLDIPGAPEIEAAVALGDNTIFSCSTAAEYLVFWRLRIARNCLLYGKRANALPLLRKTRDTKLFTKEHMFLRILAWCPSAILRFARTIKDVVR